MTDNPGVIWAPEGVGWAPEVWAGHQRCGLGTRGVGWAPEVWAGHQRCGLGTRGVGWAPEVWAGHQRVIGFSAITFIREQSRTSQNESTTVHNPIAVECSSVVGKLALYACIIMSLILWEQGFTTDKVCLRG